MESPLCHGAFADVWKGQHRGRAVAAKVLRINLISDLERIRKVSSPWLAVPTNELTSSNPGLLQGGHRVGNPSPSKRTAVLRRDNVREPVRDGVGVDGEREHQRVCEGALRCESVGARMFFV